jgi:transposase-like protein
MVMPRIDTQGFAAAGVGAEDGRRPTVVPTPAAANPEMASRPVRRRTFSAADKLQILEETDRAAGTGEVGAILRREGLYYSVLKRWREQRSAGTLNALKPVRRGPKPAAVPVDTEEMHQLRRENAVLRDRLTRAELIIECQKKVSELLAIPLSQPSSAETV